MRVGMNPTRRQLTDYHPARVTICLLVCIPEQIGYFAQRFDILKLCMQSILKHTNRPYDLLVFDNGSCTEVVDYLRSMRDQGTIQYLILSAQNVGISGALKIMYNAAPGEVIAYSQDDVLFHPNWLQAHLEILDTFPRVGMVSGVPVREQFQYGNGYLATYRSDFPEISIQYGHFIPDEWEKDFYISTGRDTEKEMETARGTCQDILLEYKGVKAYSTAVHFQYIAPKDVLLKGLATSWDPRLMAGPDVEFDERIDSMDYARLSTFQRYVQHVGNVITPELQKRVTTFGLTGKIRTSAPPASYIQKFLQHRIIRGLISRIYNWCYFLLKYQR